MHGPQTAIRADVVALDGVLRGEQYSDTLIFPRVRSSRSFDVRAGGLMVVGRLGQGVKKPGQNAPWTLTAATEADKTLAQVVGQRPRSTGRGSRRARRRSSTPVLIAVYQRDAQSGSGPSPGVDVGFGLRQSRVEGPADQAGHQTTTDERVGPSGNDRPDHHHELVRTENLYRDQTASGCQRCERQPDGPQHLCARRR